jgi:hypothetical protein
MDLDTVIIAVFCWIDEALPAAGGALHESESSFYQHAGYVMGTEGQRDIVLDAREERYGRGGRTTQNGSV